MLNKRGFGGAFGGGEFRIGLRAGAQELPGTPELPHVVAMGRVTNLHELTRRLDAPPEAGMAQILRIAYLRWGRDFHREVQGQFCGALFEEQARRLILFQDGLGLSAIYYRRDKNGFRFSTSLMELAGSGCDELDTDYLVAFLGLGGSFCELTPFRGVRRLLHGRTLVWQPDRCALDAGWQPNVAPRKLDSDDVDECFRGLLGAELDGIASQSTNLWCEVSGGLDSSFLFYALKSRTKAPGALSIVSSSLADGGDTSILRRLEADFRPRWLTLDADQHPAFSDLDPIKARVGGEPGSEIGASLVEGYAERVCASGADVLVSGLGGDQVLGSRDCEPWHIADHLARWQWNRALRQCAQWRNAQPDGRSDLWWLYRFGIRPLWRSYRGHRVSAGATPVIPWLTARAAREAHRAWDLVAVPSVGPPGTRAHWQDIALLATSEAVSTSARLPAHYHHPLLARRIVQLMLSTDFGHRRIPSQDRVLQRRVMRGLAPAALIDRSDKGTAQRNLTTGYQLAAMARQRLKESRLVQLGLFDRDAWHLALDRFAFGQSEALPQMYASMCLELWLQAFLEMTPEPAPVEPAASTMQPRRPPASAPGS